MSTIAYTVIATLPDKRAADEYVGWLDVHVKEVMRFGALTAMVVKIIEPESPVQVESRYTFADRQAFDRYIAMGAPKLRGEGLKAFPPERGVRFERRVGEVV
jgi:hypothetical protein